MIPRWSRRVPFLVMLIATVSVVFGASVAYAEATALDGKARNGREVVIPAGQTVEGNLYASGGTIRVEGKVTGDLVAMAGEVQVSGEVTGDLLAAGGTIDVSGKVGGDARLAGGRITASGTIGQDLALGAGQATVTSTAQVGQDLMFAAGQMTLDGKVTGGVLGTTQNYSKHGTVGGTEDVTIADQGEKKTSEPTVGSRVLDGFQRWVALLAVAALLLWLRPRLLRGTADGVRHRPLPSLGFGALGFVSLVVFVVAVLLVAILLAVIFGLLGLGDLVALVLFTALTVLAVTGLAVFAVLAFLAPAAVGLALGTLAFGDDRQSRRWGALALGLLVVVILTSLPVVGGWFGLLIALLGLGAVILLAWSLRPRTPQEPVAESPAT